MEINIISGEPAVNYNTITTFNEKHHPMFAFSFATNEYNEPMCISNMYVVPMARTYCRHARVLCKKYFEEEKYWIYDDDNIENFCKYVECIIRENIEIYKSHGRREDILIYTEAPYEKVGFICDYFKQFKYADLFKRLMITCR